MKTLEWEHIFPDGIRRIVKVNLTLQVDTITNLDGSFLTQSDYEDVLESLEQNADMAGGFQNLE